MTSTLKNTQTNTTNRDVSVLDVEADTEVMKISSEIQIDNKQSYAVPSNFFRSIAEKPSGHHSVGGPYGDTKTGAASLTSSSRGNKIMFHNINNKSSSKKNSSKGIPGGPNLNIKH